MNEARKAKEREGREKNRTAVSLLNPKLEKLSQNFAFCTCWALEVNSLDLIGANRLSLLVNHLSFKSSILQDLKKLTAPWWLPSFRMMCWHAKTNFLPNFKPTIWLKTRRGNKIIIFHGYHKWPRKKLILNKVGGDFHRLPASFKTIQCSHQN